MWSFVIASRFDVLCVLFMTVIKSGCLSYNSLLDSSKKSGHYCYSLDVLFVCFS